MTQSKNTIGMVLCSVAALALPCLADPPLHGDSALIDLVDSEYTSLPDFSERLVQLEQALADRRDPRAVFAAMYVVLTQNAADSIATGDFEDGDWVAGFMVAFGNLYRQAFYNFETGNIGAVPETWRTTFEAADANQITVFQHALLGIHSHINRDMPYALAAVTPLGDRARRYADFVRTNDFIVASIDPVEAAVAEFDPDLGNLDARLGGADERLLKQALTAWRFRAWRNAASLAADPSTLAYRFIAPYLDYAAAQRVVDFRDSKALFALGNADGVVGIALAPERGQGFARGGANPVPVEMRNGRVLGIDLD